MQEGLRRGVTSNTTSLRRLLNSSVLGEILARGGANASASGAKLLIVLGLARLLDRASFDLFAVAIAAVDGAVVLLNLGLPTAVVHFSTRSARGQIGALTSVLRVRVLINTVVCGAVLLSIAAAVGAGRLDTGTAQIATMATLLFAFSSAQALIDAFFLASESRGVYATRFVFPRDLVSVVLVVLVSTTQLSGVASALAMLAAVYAIHLVAVWLWARRQYAGEPEKSVLPRSAIHGFVRDYFPTALASVFQGWMLVPAVATFLSVREAGLFAVAFRVANVPAMLLPVGVAVIPWLNRSPASILRKRAWRLLLSTGAAFAVAGAISALLARWLVAWFGDNHLEAAASLVILSALIPLRAMRDVLMPVYVRGRALRVFSRTSALVGGLIAVGLSWSRDSIGFSAALVACTAVGLLISIVLLPRSFEEAA